jgi:hypothetical protein
MEMVALFALTALVLAALGSAGEVLRVPWNVAAGASDAAAHVLNKRNMSHLMLRPVGDRG